MLRKLVPSIIRRRYAARLLVVLFVTIGIIGAVGYVTVTGVTDDVAASNQQELTSTAELQSDAVANWIGKMKLVTRSIAGAQQVRSGEQRTVRRYLSREKRSLPISVKDIHYVSPENGTVVTSTSPNARSAGTEIPFSELDVGWGTAVTGVSWNRFDSGDVWVSSTSFPSVTDRVMVFGTPVEGTSDRVIVVEATVRYRLEGLSQASLNRSTSIVNASGSVIIGGETATGSAFRVDRSAVDAALGGVTTYRRGEEYVYAYAPVNTDRDPAVDSDEVPRLVAVTTVPTERAFALQQTVTRSMILVLAVALLMLGGFGAVVGYQTIRPLSALRDRARQMEQGNLDVDLATAREDEIGRLYDSFAAMRDSLKERIAEAQQARQEAERSRERVEQLNDHLQQKADAYSDTMRACAAGDLTRRLDPDSEAASMTAIAEAFNAMLDDIEATVAQVKTFAGEVATESQEVTASAQEVRNASQQVTESIQEISEGAADQNRRLEAVSQEMSSLSTTTEEIASSSNEVASIAERTAQTGRQGRAAAEDAAEGMAEIRERASAIVEATEQLEAEMEGIDDLLAFIADVAKETNMLALNANIEASRGGGEASGFAAVAEQVKEFAEETQEATDEIEQRLERIQQRSETTVREVRESNERIEANADSIERAIEALDDVAEYAQETNEGIQEISAATEQQASSVQQVVAMVDEVAGISTTTANEAETVASAAQQQTAAMTDVSESASELARRASELSEVLDRFTTDASEGSAPAGNGDPPPTDTDSGADG